MLWTALCLIGNGQVVVVNDAQMATAPASARARARRSRRSRPRRRSRLLAGAGADALAARGTPRQGVLALAAALAT